MKHVSQYIGVFPFTYEASDIVFLRRVPNNYVHISFIHIKGASSLCETHKTDGAILSTKHGVDKKQESSM